MSLDPCFRQAHCFVQRPLRFLPVPPELQLRPLPHLGLSDKFFVRGNEWSRSYREINQHPSLSWSFITHGFLDPSAFPEKRDFSVKTPFLGGAPSTLKHFRSKIRNKSRNTPETLSEQILNFQASYGWRSLDPEKQNQIPSSELCYPRYGWYRFPFWKGPGPLHGTGRAGHDKQYWGHL